MGRGGEGMRKRAGKEREGSRKGEGPNLETRCREKGGVMEGGGGRNRTVSTWCEEITKERLKARGVQK